MFKNNFDDFYKSYKMKSVPKCMHVFFINFLAWDLGVSLMEVGEVIELITDARFAYGSIGRYGTIYRYIKLHQAKYEMLTLPEHLLLFQVT